MASNINLSHAVALAAGHLVVTDLLFVFAPQICGWFAFGPCFAMQHLLSFRALQAEQERERERQTDRQTERERAVFLHTR